MKVYLTINSMQMVMVKSTVTVDDNQSCGQGSINSFGDSWGGFTSTSIAYQLGGAIRATYRRYWLYNVTPMGVGDTKSVIASPVASSSRLVFSMTKLASEFMQIKWKTD
jgi:hypothetical protein